MKYTYAYPPLLTGGLAGNLPLSVPDLGLWLKADAGITLVGGAVDAWADQSGNGRNYSAPATRPAYSGTLNGFPVLTFNGSTDYLTGDAESLTLGQNVTGLTMILVVKYAGAMIQRAFGISTSAAVDGTRALVGVSATQWQTGGRRLDADSVVLLSGGTASTATVIQSSLLRYSVATGAVFVNGASQVDTTFQTAGNSQNGASLRTIIGGGLNLANFLQGDLAEIIVYQRAISVEERNSVELYLSQKWGIAI
jgi:hypothetical protein